MASELKPGTLLRGKWRLDKFLGRGGMSSVYSATHRNGMRGAIKVLHRELVSNSVVKSRFLREGYVANRVEHPGAVKVLDDDMTEDGLVFLVMELLEGETLKQRWVREDRHLDLEITLDIADHILDVLESAHVHGIIHRDLKPDNIFLVENGATKILDFGIARVLEAALPGSADTTSSAAMMGTPAFMPPEQALAHWDKVDCRSDLFAVAATIYTVMSGRLVHSGSTIPELLVAAATRQVQSIGDALPTLDDGIVEAIDRGLKFDIEERWPDARSMRLALLQARTHASGNRTVKLTEFGATHTKPDEAAPMSVTNLTSPASTLLRPREAEPSPELAGPPNVRTVEIPAQQTPRVEARTVPTSMEVEPPIRRASKTERLSEQRRTQPVAPRASVASLSSPPPPQPLPIAEPAPAPELDATPVRLQRAIRPEHVVRLSSDSSAAPQRRRPPGWLWWTVGVATALALAIVVLVAPGTKGAPSAATGTKSNASSSATGEAGAATSTLAVVPVPATAAVGSESPAASGSPVAAESTSAAASTSTSTSTSTSASRTSSHPVRPPPPSVKKKCVKFDAFDARRCVRYE